MKILDSSVIIALFRKNEKLHKKALQLILDDDGIFVVPDYVLSEVLTVLKMREGLEVMKNCLDFLENSEDFKIYYTDKLIFGKAVERLRNTDNNLSFVDTLLLELSNLENLDLLSFDKEINKSKSSIG